MMRRILGRAAIAGMVGLIALPALAYVEYAGPGGKTVAASLAMWWNGSAAVETSPTNGLPVAAMAGSYVDGSTALSTSPQQIFAANAARVRIKLVNTEFGTATGGSGIYAWCRWGTVGASPAAAHGVGSFLVAPGGGIDDQGPGVNRSAVNCLAESGAPILYAEQY